MTGRAAEKAVREARSGSQTPASEDGRSKEGTGATVLKGGEEDYDGRYTNEVVKTMHEVCRTLLQTVKPVSNLSAGSSLAKAPDGATIDGRFHRPPRWLRNLRRSHGNGHMESAPDPPSSCCCFERYVPFNSVATLTHIGGIVNGFYSPLRQQIELAVAEGFITPANISLIKFMDLQDGDDEARDWGRRAVEALQSWVWDVSRPARHWRQRH